MTFQPKQTAAALIALAHNFSRDHIGLAPALQWHDWNFVNRVDIAFGQRSTTPNSTVCAHEIWIDQSGVRRQEKEVLLSKGQIHVNCSMESYWSRVIFLPEDGI